MKDTSTPAATVAYGAGVLATKRLTTIIVEDEITKDLRLRIWKRFPPETSKIGYVFTCTRCTSVWAGFAIFMLLQYFGVFGRAIVSALAFSESFLILEKVASNGAQRDNDDATDAFFN